MTVVNHKTNSKLCRNRPSLVHFSGDSSGHKAFSLSVAAAEPPSAALWYSLNASALFCGTPATKSHALILSPVFVEAVLPYYLRKIYYRNLHITNRPHVSNSSEMLHSCVPCFPAIAMILRHAVIFNGVCMKSAQWRFFDANLARELMAAFNDRAQTEISL